MKYSLYGRIIQFILIAPCHSCSHPLVMPEGLKGLTDIHQHVLVLVKTAVTCQYHLSIKLKWTCMLHVNLHLLVLSADNLCKQFEPRSGPTKCRARSGSKLFDTLIVFLKEFFEKNHFEKKSVDDKSTSKITQHAKI